LVELSLVDPVFPPGLLKAIGIVAHAPKIATAA
jgi:hypothetical protein